jgi:hypothetical protein
MPAGETVSDITIENNYIYSFNGDGIQNFATASYYVWILHNWIESNNNGILFQGVPGQSISEAYVLNNILSINNYGYYGNYTSMITLNRNTIRNNQYNGVYGKSSGQFILTENTVDGNGQHASNTIDEIYLWSTHFATITGNDIGYASTAARYCLNLYYCNNATVVANTFHPDLSGSFVQTGATFLNCHYNVGYITENSGTANSVVNGTWIAHGLAVTPSSIRLTLDVSSYLSDSSYLLQPTVLAVNSTHFQIGVLNYSQINRLAGITPTYTSWTINPSQGANSTDGDWSTATGFGAKNVSSSTELGTFTYDLGAVYSLEVYGKFGFYSNTSSVNIYIQYSTNGVSYVAATSAAITGGSATSERVTFSMMVFVQTRYLRFQFYSGGQEAGFGQIYEVQAIDMSQNLQAVAGSGVSVFWSASG